MTMETVRFRVAPGIGFTPLGEHPVVRAALAGKPRISERTELCFDTPDLRLWRSGILVTLQRTGSKWHGLLTQTQDGAETVREWEGGHDERPDWSAFKRLLPEGVLEGFKSKSLEPLLTIEVREERWRLEFPDHSRITLRELRGHLLRAGQVVEPIHEVVLEGSGGTPLRFMQTALAVGRHCSATMEPLTPVARGLARLDPSPLAPTGWSSLPALPGERVIQGLTRAGAAQVLRLAQQLAPLLYGSEELRLQAMTQMDQAISELRRLIEWFGELLPELLRRDMESELHWLSGALSQGCPESGLAREVLPRMCARFPDHPRLAELMRQAQIDLNRSVEQSVAAVNSFRFTRLFLGFAIWLSGEEGLKAAMMESDASVRERLAAPMEGLGREILRRVFRPLHDAGKKIEGRALLPEELSAWLSATESMDQASEWFAAMPGERKGGAGRQPIAELIQALRRMTSLEAERQHWQRLVDPESGEPVIFLFQGWQGARLDAAWLTLQQTWESALTASAPWVRD